MRPLSLKLMVVAGMLTLLITGCAPKAPVTPAATAAPTVPADGLTVIPADLTPLPTGIAATLPAPDHADFMEIDKTTEPWAGIQQRIADAFAAGEAWADDPDQIALEFSVNQTAMPQAETIQRSDTHAIMLITELIGEDDSIAEQQILVELSRASADTAWVVDWMGMRWKCREGRGQQDFAPQLCV